MIQLTPKNRPELYGRLKLARLLEMPERHFEKEIKKLESHVFFQRLREAGILSVVRYERCRFFERRLQGWELRRSSEGVAHLLEGQAEIIKIIEGLGPQRFRDYFVHDEGFSAEDCARALGLPKAEVLRIQDFMNKVFIQNELEGGPLQASSTADVFSSVAGIEIEQGRPVLGFFNQEIWKGRYRINQEKCRVWLQGLPCQEATIVQKFLNKLEFIDRRKTTLHRALEILMDAQSAFLITGDLSRRRPLPQKELAGRLNVTASALSRLISNKSVHLPGGLEVPLQTFLPNAKSLLKERLGLLALKHPDWSDEQLRLDMERLHEARLSRRSIAQYRQELGLGPRQKRS